MAEFKNTAIRLYRRYFGSPTDAEMHAAGIETVLTGEQAVAISELAISQAAVLGGSEQLSDAGRSWQESTGETSPNAFGKPVATIQAEDARGVVASALGLGLAGRRTTAFLDGQDIASVQDLLYSASGRHLPLVFHLTNRAVASQGGAVGSGHEGFHLSAETGCFTLFAANAQEAVDFTAIARRVAEQCLVPGLVAMDAEQTALSAQDVHLLAPQQLQSFIGPADGILTVPTEAQKLLFGMQRRRVPRWHNVDRPVLQGAVYDRESYALGALGRQAFFDGYVSECLADTLKRFARLTGRRYEPLSCHRVDDAEIVFVVQGSAVETARAAADYLRGIRQAKVGVVGLSSLRPLPTSQLTQTLRNCISVVVLERVQMPPGGTGPLVRELSSVLGTAMPPVSSVSYGIGGAPLRVADLAMIPERLAQGAANFALGVDYTRQQDDHPKREVLLNALTRAYPELERAGLRANEPLDLPLPEDSLAFLISRKRRSDMAELAPEIAGLLHRMDTGRVRGCVQAAGAEWGNDSCDYLIYGTDELLDPGDDAPADVFVVTETFKRLPLSTLRRLRQDGIVLFAGMDAAGAASIVPAGFMNVVREKNLRLYQTGEAGDHEGITAVEYVLGCVFGAMLTESRVAFKERKLVASRPEDLSETFEQGLKQCLPLDESVFDDLTSAQGRRVDSEAPSTVKALGRGDDQFDSLPRFRDQVGVLYDEGEQASLTVDPYFATGTVAPLSSTFRDLSGTRDTLPVFDPAACTGCGECWSACPDSAIGPVAIGPSALVDTGIKLANGATALRQAGNQLASRIISQGKKDALEPTAAAILRTEYAWLKEKMSLTPEREEALSTAVDKAADALGEFPLAVTEPLFHDAEKVKKDSGELLAVAINPDVCKGCGICVAQCEPLALSLEEQNAMNLDEARTRWNVWAETPDTPSATIDRLMEEGSIGHLAALNLSRYCLHAMAGGDSAEPGSGEKIALRMTLAATEYHAQPLLNRFAHDVRETAEGLVQRIQGMLASAMPVDDLEFLERTLERVNSATFDLTSLAQAVDTAIEGHKVDAHALRRLTRLAEDLNELCDTVSRGVQGLGRARFGLAVAPGTVTEWMGEFPYNAFQSPVVVDFTGETAQMAAGLVEGHLRDTCESIALLRKARLEIEQPAGVEFERAKLDGLQWRDLTDEERRVCPPLILVGNDQVLAGAGLSQVLWLLSSDLPIKIVTLADLDFGASLHTRGRRSTPVRHDPRGNLVLLALAARNAYVAQTSIGHCDHLQSGIDDALAWSGPALIRIHCPSPSRHGFKRDAAISQAKLACSSRAYPLLTYDPRRQGVHGTRISLAGNPDPGEPWAGSEDGIVTPAHWALNESRFSACFTRLHDDTTGVELSDYLEMDAQGRAGKKPVLTLGYEEDRERYEVGAAMIRVIEEQRESWQVLQELAGVVTPFTERVWEDARDGVRNEHEAEMAALKSEYEDKIKELTANIQQEVAGKIRGQLMTLVNMKPPRDIQTENEGG